MKKFLIVGTGFSGAVIAERLSENLDCSITMIDERSHIGGNCYTERDKETDVMVHTYGPHIFNTDNVEVWDYIQKFGEFIPYINRVKAVYKKHIYSMPINLHTINQFFNKSLNPEEAKQLIESLGEKGIEKPQNFEEQALKFLGKDLYKAFFYGYTKKQWGCEPTELPADILKRLPIRFNYNDNYYANPIQGIPKDGYTALFDKMLAHPYITIKLNTKFDKNYDISKYDHVFYTGPIDAFFDYKYGRLSYRTVFFEKKVVDGDYQGNAVINYTDDSVPYTRVHEHKHFTPWETHAKTTVFTEYSKETSPTDVPYYPKRLSADMEKLVKYQEELPKLSNFTFIGRLATYRYMDMHHVIAEALAVAKTFIENQNAAMPVQTVATVVVTYNRLSMLKDCIMALEAQTWKIDDIVVINNGSTDGTQEWLATRPDLIVINQTNVGGAGGFYTGLEEAYNRGYDWIWIMDDDVVAHKDCLKELLAVNKPIAIPLRISKQASFKDLPAIKYDLKNPFINNPRVVINDELGINSFEELPEELLVEDLSFEGPLFSRKVVEKVGLPEKKLFIYHDDTEYGLRCNRIFNFPIVLVKNAALHRQVEDKDEVNWKSYYKFRNKSFIHIKYGDNLLVKLKPFALFISSLVKDAFKFKFHSEKQKYRFWGLVDAYSANYTRRF